MPIKSTISMDIYSICLVSMDKDWMTWMSGKWFDINGVMAPSWSNPSWKQTESLKHMKDKSVTSNEEVDMNIIWHAEGKISCSNHHLIVDYYVGI